MGYACIGLIGGTGLDRLTLFADARTERLETPHGEPSGPFQVGQLPPPSLGQQPGPMVVTIARHGREHTIPPHRVNHRANLWGLKELGCDAVLATSSVGALKGEIEPGTLVVPNDYLCTYPGPTFFDEEVHHIIPVLSRELRRSLVRAAKRLKEPVADEGVYVQTPGPRLETKAEVRWYAYGGDIVGMTMAHEAALAQELGLPYACLCRVDNAAHGLGSQELTMEEIFERAADTGSRAQKVLLRAAEMLAGSA